MLSAFLFLSFPQIDLHISALFYDKEDKFFLSNNFLLVFLHESVKYITIACCVLWVGLLILNFVTKKQYISNLILVYLILALSFGPGLVVNTVFKENWGRARPAHIEQFGGDKIFSPPFAISDQCEENCSFLAGDPSVGFYFIALAFAIPVRRKQFMVLAMSLGIIFGTARVMQGVHFVSDVIFSGFFTILVCYSLHKLLVSFK
jgi:lipid A 4'-phosphatase